MKKFFVMCLLMFPCSLFANTEQILCLSQNIYHEARGEGELGMLAVAYVTMNRVDDKRFPDTVCDVVKYSLEKPTGRVCAFSWVCQGKGTPRLKTRLQRNTWLWIMRLSEDIYTNWDELKELDITNGSTHYHANYVSPKWAKLYEKTMEIENHIFYVAEIL